MAGGTLSGQLSGGGGFLGGRRWQAAGVALGGVLVLAVLVQAALAPLPLRRSQDPTLARLGGWPGFATEVDAARRAQGASFIATEEYGLASELALLLPDTMVVAVGDRWDLFDLPDAPAGQTGLLVRSRRRTDGLWPAAAPVGEVVRRRKGIEAERYGLYRVATPQGTQASAILPGRR